MSKKGFIEAVQESLVKMAGGQGTVLVEGWGLVGKRQYGGFDFMTIGKMHRDVDAPQRVTLASVVAQVVMLYQNMGSEAFKGMFVPERGSKKGIEQDASGFVHLMEVVKKDVMETYSIKVRLKWSREIYVYVMCVDDEIISGTREAF